MTPQERQLVSELFDRLTTLENAPRDSDAERAVMEGLQRAPHATYALVQTALVQDETLKRADARIGELEARLGEDSAPRPGEFLDAMRDALAGRRAEPPGGSVPSVRPQVQSQGAAPAPSVPWQGSGPTGGGSSFLGTAAASAAGVIGGSLLLNSIRSMVGPSHALGGADSAFGAIPSSQEHSSGGDLARQGGVDDIGHRGDESSLSDNSADDNAADDQADQDVEDLGDDSGDFSGDDSGNSDV